ncbi:MAG: acyl-CoA dehydrogenase [Candidatus Eisenbacteria bacterium]|nr:acyl-CoA dehydrogenase [Candidatus Latescibacterota bacterium]MBD3302680.1 acyl-CoA dehydrogenase [Candidatus Eisenbacteria bacterium]
MIDFELTEDQRDLQKLARDFAQREIAPKAAHQDETGEYPWEIVRKAWETGLMNTHVPEEYGGLGLGVLDGCVIAEEIAAACSGIGTAMEANTLAEAPLIVGASEEQKRKWLTPMIEEFRLAAYCVTEPDAGSDVAGLRTTARKVGSEYVLNGSKMWITNGGVADWYFVIALTNPERGARGMSAFVVPKESDGIEVGKKEQNLGQRASDTRGITFNEVVVPEENRIGPEGRGWFLAMSAFDHTRPAVAAAAVGVARAALQHAVRYAKERKSFGVPIAQHQAIAFMLADMSRDVEASRLLVYKAAWSVDRGRPSQLEAAYAKLMAADTCMRVTIDAVQVFGGYGYSREYPVEKLMRDAKVFQIYEGTSQIQRHIISKGVLKKGA